MKPRFIIIALFVFSAISSLFAQENSSVYTSKFGTMDINLLQEVSKIDKPNILIGTTPQILEACSTDGTFPGAVNAFLVRANGKNILIDSGFGTKLFDNLQSLGIAAADIDIVLLTHMHGDHIGGMMKDGNISFPNADVYLSQREHNYWLHETDNKGAHAVLTAYKDRLHLFQPDVLGGQLEPIFPGVQAFEAYGHTPGHTVYLFKSEDKPFLIIGDVINVSAVQIPYPQIAAVYDTNAEEASATRRKVLEFAANNNIPIAGMHIPYTGMGYVLNNATNGFKFKTIE